MDQTVTVLADEAHRLDPTTLREYDVRGVVGKTLSERDARAIGRAFGTMLREQGGRRIAVGYDGRLSSPALEEALVGGLSACGLEVLRVGLGPTPMLYFAVHKLEADAGIQVTGSHNPPDYNGFKIMLGRGPFYGEQILKLGEVAASGKFVAGEGRVEHREVFEDYVARLIADFAPGRPLAIVWDAGNGAAGPATVALTERLPGRHVLLNVEVDGRFPAHHPDPTVEKNLAQLQAAVAKEKADLGIAFDGDGDRIGVIDGKGRVLWGDQLLAMLARPGVQSLPKAVIIADVKASQILFDEVARIGGTPVMWKTGHSLIKAKMKELDAPLAGEMSGHIFFAHRWYGFDDALYAAVRFIEYVAGQDHSVAALRDALPQVVNTPEIRFPCADTRKFAVVEEVVARLKAAGAKFNDVDGVRVQTQDGWWLLRASNTQDVLVARCESQDEAGLARLKKALADALTPSKVALPEF
jgi:phosphomannomutase